MGHIGFHENLALATETLAAVKVLGTALGMEQYFFIPTLTGGVHQGRQDLIAQTLAAQHPFDRHAANFGDAIHRWKQTTSCHRKAQAVAQHRMNAMLIAGIPL